MREALEKPTVRQMIESTLRGTVDFLSTPGNPKGCLSIQGALAVGDEAGTIKKWLIQARKHGESVARERFEKAKGELGTNADPAALASYFATLLQGLCVSLDAMRAAHQLVETTRTIGKVVIAII
jgi:hypothetical protein